LNINQIKGNDWKENLIKSLKSEKSKLSKQCESARERLNRAQKELEVLYALNKNLLANQQEWQQRVQQAMDSLSAIEKTYRFGENFESIKSA
jgi:predicted  nucleic acid-binding Zn-ribbon protein